MDDLLSQIALIGIQSVMVEGGAVTLASFARYPHLVDGAVVTVSPRMTSDMTHRVKMALSLNDCIVSHVGQDAVLVSTNITAEPPPKSHL